MKKQTKKKKALTLIGPKDHTGNDNSRRERIHKRGFTLIELIVVMAVIGILVLLAAPKFLGYTQKAQETKHIHTAKVIETALEAYLIHGGVFPEDLEVVDEATLNEAVNSESLYGVNGLISSPDGETYYELTHDFIQKLDVKLSANNKLFIEAMASSVPAAMYASEKGITLVDKEKSLKGYVLQTGELPNEINPDDIRQIAAGGFHTLALMENGSVMAWGGNVYGQLGDGTTTNSSTPVPVENLRGLVKSLAAGANHSLALMEDGTVKAWGHNGYGQLGDGNTTNSSTPVTVENLVGPVKVLTSGYHHSLAIMATGSIMAWGHNGYGQLGNGNTTNSSMPVPVKNLTETAKALTAGGFHSLALMDDGTVKAWGRNYEGQLGDGNTINKHTPVTIPELTGVNALTAGAYYTLAFMHNDTVMAWGANNHGQLGDGTTTNSSTPVPVEGLDRPVKALAAGNRHTLALMENGSVMAWGYNLYGQLGNGSTTESSTPVSMKNLTGPVKVLTAGAYHSLALIEDGSVKAWGRNDLGQLGDGTTENRLTPTIITIE